MTPLARRARLIIVVLSALVLFFLYVYPAKAGPGLRVASAAHGTVAEPELNAWWHQHLGMETIRVSVFWRPSYGAHPANVPAVYDRLERVFALADQYGLKTIITFSSVANGAPRTVGEDYDLARFITNTYREWPQLHAAEVWNEPNSSFFWDQGPDRYAQLLLRVYGYVHDRVPQARLLCFATAPSNNPAAFIRNVGDYYRTPARARPICDGFAHHPYPRDPAEPVTKTHSSFIAIADHQRLRAAYVDAFSGTAQPGLGKSVTPYWTMRLWYTEAGYDTREIGESLQSSQTKAAIRAAYCQSNVVLWTNLQIRDLAGDWQTGVIREDHSAKPVAYGVRNQIPALDPSIC